MIRGMKIVLIGGMALAFATPLLAQTPSKPRRLETPHVAVTPLAVAGSVAPGARVSLRLDVAPKPTMHVYSPEQKDYIPVSLTIENNAAFTAQPAVFPTPEKYFFKALGETQLVYSKPFQIVQDVTIRSTPALRDRARTKGATLVVKGTLEYQACDESVCFRPASVPVEWTVPLAALKK